MSWLLIYKCEIQKPKDLNSCSHESYNWFSKWLGESFDKHARNYTNHIIGSGSNDASIWYNSVKELGNFNLDIILSNEIIFKRIIPHFTRYEQRCFFMLIFQTELKPDMSRPFIDDYLKRGLEVGNKICNVNVCTSSYQIKYKTGLYNEFLGIKQPIIVDLNDVNRKVLDVNYTVLYDKAESSNYFREMNIEILGNQDYSIDDYSTLAHTFISYFVRTQSLENTLARNDDYNDKFQIVLSRFNNYWTEIRRSYILLSEKSILARNFKELTPRKLLGKQLAVIGLLEAQMTKVKHIYLDVNREFEKSYERLQLNVQQYNNKMLEDFALKLKDLLLTNHKQKEKAFNNNYEMMLLYKSGIIELRNDHDSENSMTVQILMSILSIALIFWSAGTLAYDKYMQISKPLSTSLAQYSGYLLPAALGFVILIYIISMRMMIKTSNIYDKKLMKYIRENDFVNIKKMLKNYKLEGNAKHDKLDITQIARESDKLICFLLLYFHENASAETVDLFKDFQIESSITK